MRVVLLALSLLLIGAAPVDVPLGRFQTWTSSHREPLTFSSGGISIAVQALPCPPKPPHSDDTTCSWEGYNNQGQVTVTAPGMTPATLTTDSQGSYARIAVVRFDRRDPRLGVIVESQYGGSGGILTVQLVLPGPNGFRILPLSDGQRSQFEGQIADGPRDLSGDGLLDLRLADPAFGSAFGCNACTPRPPLLFTVRDGRAVDESRDPALRHVFAAEMARLAPGCFSNDHDRNGTCAAYVAAGARAGLFEKAWSAMLQHYDREDRNLWEPCDVPPSQWVNHLCPEEHLTRFRTFPESLRAFLIRAGYLPA